MRSDEHREKSDARDVPWQSMHTSPTNRSGPDCFMQTLQGRTDIMSYFSPRVIDLVIDLLIYLLFTTFAQGSVKTCPGFEFSNTLNMNMITILHDIIDLRFYGFFTVSLGGWEIV